MLYINYIQSKYGLLSQNTLYSLLRCSKIGIEDVGHCISVNIHNEYVYTNHSDSPSTASYKLEGIEATQNKFY